MPEHLYGREFWVRDLDDPGPPVLIKGWQQKDVASAWAARYLSEGEEARLEIRSLQSGRVWTCNVRSFVTSHVWGVEEVD